MGGDHARTVGRARGMRDAVNLVAAWAIVAGHGGGVAGGGRKSGQVGPQVHLSAWGGERRPGGLCRLCARGKTVGLRRGEGGIGPSPQGRKEDLIPFSFYLID